VLNTRGQTSLFVLYKYKGLIRTCKCNIEQPCDNTLSLTFVSNEIDPTKENGYRWLLFKGNLLFNPKYIYMYTLSIMGVLFLAYN